MENRSVIELERGAVLSVPVRRGTRVSCLQGVLWLTEDRNPNDIILSAGRTHAAQRKGRALVQALEPARIALENGVRPHLENGVRPYLGLLVR